MGLYKGQNIIAGSYMLPRADNIRQINVSGTRRSKKKERRGRKTKKHKFYPFYDSGTYDIQEKEKEYIA
jgi:hypothetical protein